MNAQRPLLQAQDVLQPLTSLSAVRTFRSALARRSAESVAANSTVTDTVHDSDVHRTADDSPVRFILPDGRQFQIQMVVRRGRQPEWSFSGLNNLFSAAPTAYVHQDSDTECDSTAVIPEQIHTAAAATEDEDSLAQAAAAAAAEALPWSFSEYSSSSSSSSFDVPAIPIAAVHADVAEAAAAATEAPTAAAAAAADLHRDHAYMLWEGVLEAPAEAAAVGPAAAMARPQHVVEIGAAVIAVRPTPPAAAAAAAADAYLSNTVEIQSEIGEHLQQDLADVLAPPPAAAAAAEAAADAYLVNTVEVQSEVEEQSLQDLTDASTPAAAAAAKAAAAAAAAVEMKLDLKDTAAAAADVARLLHGGLAADNATNEAAAAAAVAAVAESVLQLPAAQRDVIVAAPAAAAVPVAAAATVPVAAAAAARKTAASAIEAAAAAIQAAAAAAAAPAVTAAAAAVVQPGSPATQAAAAAVAAEADSPPGSQAAAAQAVQPGLPTTKAAAAAVPSAALSAAAAAASVVQQLLSATAAAVADQAVSVIKVLPPSQQQQQQLPKKQQRQQHAPGTSGIIPSQQELSADVGQAAIATMPPTQQQQLSRQQQHAPGALGFSPPPQELSTDVGQAAMATMPPSQQQQHAGIFAPPPAQQGILARSADGIITAAGVILLQQQQESREEEVQQRTSKQLLQQEIEMAFASGLEALLDAQQQQQQQVNAAERQEEVEEKVASGAVGLPTWQRQQQQQVDLAVNVLQENSHQQGQQQQKGADTLVDYKQRWQQQQQQQQVAGQLLEASHLQPQPQQQRQRRQRIEPTSSVEETVVTTGVGANAPHHHQQQQLWQQQQHGADTIGQGLVTEEGILARMQAANQPWQVVDAVYRYLPYSESFTAAVAAAALQKLDKLIKIDLVRKLQAGNEPSNPRFMITPPGAVYGRQRRSTPAAAAADQAGSGDLDQELSSSSIKRDGWAGPALRSLQEEEDDLTDTAAATAAGSSARRQQQRAAAAAAAAGRPATASSQLRVLMRVFLRLISILEADIHEVPAAGLVSAAKLSAKLVAGDNPVRDWWRRARGYVFIAEATTRWKAGVLDIRSAVDMCYSYHHCGFKPDALLQPLLVDVVRQPELLLQLNGTGLCHLTFCATTYMDTVNFKQEELAAAVSDALRNPEFLGFMTVIKPYDLVMTLRHLCQLSSDPPQGLLMPQSVSDLTPRLLSDLDLDLDLDLGISHCCWQQQQQGKGTGDQQQQQQQGEREVDQQLLLADQILEKLQQQQQQGQQQQDGEGQLLLAVIGRMPHMTMQELSTVLHVAVEWQLDCCRDLAAAAATLVAAAAGLPIQQQQQQQLEGVPSLLLQLRADLQQQLQHVMDQPARPQTTSSAAAVVTKVQRHLQQINAYVAAWSDALAAAAAGSSSSRLPVQLPRTVADPVIFLHRLCQCGYRPSRYLSDWLLQQLGPNLHKISLLQANLLYRTLIHQWEDDQACSRLLSAGLGPWVIDHPAAAAAGSSRSAAASVDPAVFKLPYWQLKALLVAAGRFGVLAGRVAAAGSSSCWQQQQQRWPPTDQPTAAGSSSSTGSGSTGRGIAIAFVQGILQHLSPVSSSSSSSGSHGISADLSAWRADMVLALFWTLARLKITPNAAITAAGTAALTQRMRRHIAAHELPLLVWTAAELKISDLTFLNALCGSVATNAHHMHPKSIATAAWSLVQLRCPHTAVLQSLSKALLRPDDISSSREILHSKIWHRQQRQQQQPSDHDLRDWDPDQARSQIRSQIRSHRAAAAATGNRRGSSTAGQSLNYPSFDLRIRHPRVNLLESDHVSKLAAACVMGGWAPPLLLLLLAVRAEVIMETMPPEHLAQLMWTYASANCPISSMLHAAAARAAQLAAAAAFTDSKQPLALLGAFRSLGLSSNEANLLLKSEVRRLKQLEQQQQQQQPFVVPQPQQQQQHGCAEPHWQQQQQKSSGMSRQQQQQQQQRSMRSVMADLRQQQEQLQTTMSVV